MAVELEELGVANPLVLIDFPRDARGRGGRGFGSESRRLFRGLPFSLRLSGKGERESLARLEEELSERGFDGIITLGERAADRAKALIGGGRKLPFIYLFLPCRDVKGVTSFHEGARGLVSSPEFFPQRIFFDTRFLKWVTDREMRECAEGAVVMAAYALCHGEGDPFIQAYASEALFLLDSVDEVFESRRGKAPSRIEGGLKIVNASLLAQYAFANAVLPPPEPGEGWEAFLARTAPPLPDFDEGLSKFLSQFRRKEVVL